MAVLGLDGKVLEVSSYYKVPRKQLIGKKFDEVQIIKVHPEDLPIFKQYLNRLIKGEKVNSLEIRLLFPNNDLVRESIVKILEASGYKMLSADSGKQALAKMKDQKESPDLIITDLTMRGMSGNKLAMEMSKLLPRTKILFITGYIDDSIFAQAMPQWSENFILKPFRSETLCKKIREVLNQPKSKTEI